MKFAQELYPKGTFKGQETDGAYINETLGENLDIIAKNIANDMTFLLLISGHDMVGDGKSTIMTQVGTYLTWKINQLHKTNNTFTDKNVLMNSEALTKTSFELPAFSVIGLDEGDDIATHGMRELAVRLKRYFRKCRQLNQILIIILPSFFELPKFYALSRSHLLIDCFFQKEYERGYFKFYGPHAKKLLYLKGKKDWNYDAQRSDFHGRFFSSYCFFPDLDGCIKRYKAKKYQDMINDAKETDTRQSKAQIEKAQTIKLFKQLHQNLDKITIKDLSMAFGVSAKTGSRWFNDEKEDISDTPLKDSPERTLNVNDTIIEKYFIKEEDLNQQDETKQ